jgi:hypothetical protein
MSDDIEGRFRPKKVAALEGCGLTTVYGRVRKGEYDAVKDGHLTLINGRVNQVPPRRLATCRVHTAWRAWPHNPKETRMTTPMIQRYMAALPPADVNEATIPAT